MRTTARRLLSTAVVGVVAAIAVTACGDGGSNDSSLQHVPEITEVLLTPSMALEMEGEGSIQVTAQVGYFDEGQDIETLWVRMPDGTTLEFGQDTATELGTLTEQLLVSTGNVGVAVLEFWLEDEAGDRSITASARFSVVVVPGPSNWTSRLSGLPYGLNDVVWDGTVFVAVGDSGAVLTSDNGIEWVAKESGTQKSLGALAVHGSDIFAVGFEVVLRSADHGESWVIKHEPRGAMLGAVVANASQVVVAGNQVDLFLPRVMVSTDRGETWVEPTLEWGDFFGFFSDLSYRDGLYLAANNLFSGGGQAMVSSDGLTWTEAFRDEDAGMAAILHDGSKYIVAGGNGAVFSSLDGLNWIKTHTVVEDADYLSGAWNGSEMMFAGGYSWRYYSRRITPEVEVPVGISSTDGGLTWQVFNIDGEYQSRGMAWGNGLFVSVGQSAPVSGEGAIYTSD